MIAKLGFLVTKKESCAKITDQKGKKLAYKCHGSNSDKLTEKQASEKLYTHGSIIGVEWINSFTIDVTFDYLDFELFNENELQTKADLYAQVAYVYTKKPTCVKITDFRGDEYAYKCHGNEPL